MEGQGKQSRVAFHRLQVTAPSATSQARRSLQPTRPIKATTHKHHNQDTKRAPRHGSAPKDAWSVMRYSHASCVDTVWIRRILSHTPRPWPSRQSSQPAQNAYNNKMTHNSRTHGTGTPALAADAGKRGPLQCGASDARVPIRLQSRCRHQSPCKHICII
jgi:hypothetical protein